MQKIHYLYPYDNDMNMMNQNDCNIILVILIFIIIIFDFPCKEIKLRKKEINKKRERKKTLKPQNSTLKIECILNFK